MPAPPAAAHGAAPAEPPLYRRLYLRLREAILAGTLKPGQRLASTRSMAQQTGLARNTVLQAFAQLEAEGYVQARRGSGHFVSPLLRSPPPAGAPRRGPARPERALRDASPLPRQAFEFVPASLRQPLPGLPFRINQPALDAFPLDTWMRMQSRVLREARATGSVPALLGEAAAQGDLALREAIADHVSIARGVQCSADAVVVTAGAQHAMDLLLRVLTQPGDAVGLEDPCFPGAHSAALAAGCRIVPVPVDAQGADLGAALAPSPAPRVLLVCPSKQFPLGVTMSLPRRLALIEWARRESAWIVEDDYDSEYRYDGQPIPSLQGLDGGRHVIYVGTFSKVLFPSLRTGFIVAPPALVEPLIGARAVSGRHGSALEQRVLARFIDSGHLSRHVRRMRTLYAERQRVLLRLCEQKLHRHLRVEATASGLQTLAWLPPSRDDARTAEAGRRLGLELAPLSRFRLQAAHPPALVLGFGGFDEARLRDGVARMARLFA